VREMVAETISLSATLPGGSPAFTPRAKKVLELSLREAIGLGHNYIGTEHMLLGMVREGEGVAVQVLVSLGADLVHVRETVVRLLAKDAGPGARWPGEQARVAGRGGWSARSSGRRPAGIVACSFCGRRPPETGQLISGADAFICEHCIRDWFGSLSTAHGSQPLFGTRRAAVGVVENAGPPPEDQEAARAQIAAAYSASTIVGEDGQSVPSVERGANLAPALLQAQARSPFPESTVTIEVNHVAFVDSEHAIVSFTIVIDGVPRLSERRGGAVLVDRTWKMARSTFCDLMMLAGVECPPEPDR
jgi:hypothetical protein